MEDIEELCRRIVIIREGEFVYDGLTKDLVASYATTRIIRFVPPADVAREQLERDLRSFPSVELDEGLTARITVERSNVGHAISALLTMYPDSDFSVAEGDISNVVASIMQSGRRNE
jgi:ABC-2 type transport system ATP-binding protein